MRKQRPLLTVQYNGGNRFIPVTYGTKSFTFKSGAPVKNIPHELLESLMENYPGEIEVVAVESENTKIIETNLDDSQPEVRTLARRGRRS